MSVTVRQVGRSLGVLLWGLGFGLYVWGCVLIFGCMAPVAGSASKTEGGQQVHQQVELDQSEGKSETHGVSGTFRARPGDGGNRRTDDAPGHGDGALPAASQASKGAGRA